MPEGLSAGEPEPQPKVGFRERLKQRFGRTESVDKNLSVEEIREQLNALRSDVMIFDDDGNEITQEHNPAKEAELKQALIQAILKKSKEGELSPEDNDDLVKDLVENGHQSAMADISVSTHGFRNFQKMLDVTGQKSIEVDGEEVNRETKSFILSKIDKLPEYWRRQVKNGIVAGTISAAVIGLLAVTVGAPVGIAAISFGGATLAKGAADKLFRDRLIHKDKDGDGSLAYKIAQDRAGNITEMMELGKNYQAELDPNRKAQILQEILERTKKRESENLKQYESLSRKAAWIEGISGAAGAMVTGALTHSIVMGQEVKQQIAHWAKDGVQIHDNQLVTDPNVGHNVKETADGTWRFILKQADIDKAKHLFGAHWQQYLHGAGQNGPFGQGMSPVAPSHLLPGQEIFHNSKFAEVVINRLAAHEVVSHISTLGTVGAIAVPGAASGLASEMYNNPTSQKSPLSSQHAEASSDTPTETDSDITEDIPIDTDTDGTSGTEPVDTEPEPDKAELDQSGRKNDTIKDSLDPSETIEDKKVDRSDRQQRISDKAEKISRISISEAGSYCQTVYREAYKFARELQRGEGVYDADALTAIGVIMDLVKNGESSTKNSFRFAEKVFSQNDDELRAIASRINDPTLSNESRRNSLSDLVEHIIPLIQISDNQADSGTVEEKESILKEIKNGNEIELPVKDKDGKNLILNEQIVDGLKFKLYNPSATLLEKTKVIWEKYKDKDRAKVKIHSSVPREKVYYYELVDPDAEPATVSSEPVGGAEKTEKSAEPTKLPEFKIENLEALHVNQEIPLTDTERLFIEKDPVGNFIVPEIMINGSRIALDDRRKNHVHHDNKIVVITKIPGTSAGDLLYHGELADAPQKTSEPILSSKGEPVVEPEETPKPVEPTELPKFEADKFEGLHVGQQITLRGKTENLVAKGGEPPLVQVNGTNIKIDNPDKVAVQHGHQIVEVTTVPGNSPEDMYFHAKLVDTPSVLSKLEQSTPQPEVERKRMEIHLSLPDVGEIKKGDELTIDNPVVSDSFIHNVLALPTLVINGKNCILYDPKHPEDIKLAREYLGKEKIKIKLISQDERTGTFKYIFLEPDSSTKEKVAKNVDDTAGTNPANAVEAPAGQNLTRHAEGPIKIERESNYTGRQKVAFDRVMAVENMSPEQAKDYYLKVYRQAVNFESSSGVSIPNEDLFAFGLISDLIRSTDEPTTVDFNDAISIREKDAATITDMSKEILATNDDHYRQIGLSELGRHIVTLIPNNEEPPAVPTPATESITTPTEPEVGAQAAAPISSAAKKSAESATVESESQRLENEIAKLPDEFKRFIEGLQSVEEHIYSKDTEWLCSSDGLAHLDRFVYAPAPSLGRAIGHDASEISRYLSGIVQSQAELHNQLDAIGMHPFDAKVGDAFNSDNYDSPDEEFVWISDGQERHNHIAGVSRIGYKLGDKVVRKARVKRWMYHEPSPGQSAEPTSTATEITAAKTPGRPEDDIIIEDIGDVTERLQQYDARLNQDDRYQRMTEPEKLFCRIYLDARGFTDDNVQYSLDLRNTDAESFDIALEYTTSILNREFSDNLRYEYYVTLRNWLTKL
ncbi:MAG: nucleotide exchange factor GrpE [Patescibacteria group bacterium]|jgi:molecular chaperone GrpE (heat shock protein)